MVYEVGRKSADPLGVPRIDGRPKNRAVRERNFQIALAEDPEMTEMRFACDLPTVKVKLQWLCPGPVQSQRNVSKEVAPPELLYLSLDSFSQCIGLSVRASVMPSSSSSVLPQCNSVLYFYPTSTKFLP